MHFIEQVATLQTSHEIEKLLELFADDATFEDMALGIVADGRAKIREMFESIYASMPDYAQTLVCAVADKHRGGAKWITSGTLTGDFSGLKTTGELFSVRAAAAIRFRDATISRWTDYWSVSIFKQQVGLERNATTLPKLSCLVNEVNLCSTCPAGHCLPARVRPQ